MERYKNRAWLKKQYINGDMTDKQIADLCNVTDRTIRWWREKFRITKKRNFNKKAKYLRIRVSYDLYKTIRTYCDSKSISLSEGISRVVLEFLIKNNLNPYK